jgi:hypothetical protein
MYFRAVPASRQGRRPRRSFLTRAATAGCESNNSPASRSHPKSNTAGHRQGKALGDKAVAQDAPIGSIVEIGRAPAARIGSQRRGPD